MLDTLSDGVMWALFLFSMLHNFEDSEDIVIRLVAIESSVQSNSLQTHQWISLQFLGGQRILADLSFNVCPFDLV